MKLSPRQLAHVLAALRYCQAGHIDLGGMDHFGDMDTGLYPLNDQEIDDLCEGLNSGVSNEISRFTMLNDGANPNGYKAYADRSGSDPGVYEEVNITIVNSKGDNVADVGVGLSSDGGTEPVVRVSAGGNPDNIVFYIKPERSAEEALIETPSGV